jgi:hypothetical protein
MDNQTNPSTTKPRNGEISMNETQLVASIIVGLFSLAVMFEVARRRRAKKNAFTGSTIVTAIVVHPTDEDFPNDVTYVLPNGHGRKIRVPARGGIYQPGTYVAELQYDKEHPDMAVQIVKLISGDFAFLRSAIDLQMAQ